MCGITGFWKRPSGAEGDLGTMTKTLVHRGPDEGGLFAEGPVGLGNRRLSILDLEGGRQPVYNEDGSLVVVYNGEIYNYPSLRRALEARGHRFSTSADTEILVHAYEEYGLEFMSHLRGMFAFALYDRHRRRLILARDPFGIKPLIYTELPQGVFFASEIRALLALPFFPREPDLQALALYAAFNYIPAPFTAWKAARRLPPGHWMLIEEGHIQFVRSYVTWPSEPAPTTIDEAIARLQDTLAESVQAHLLADVPVGAFLSGGLDSSLVVALAQQSASQPLRTFTVSFPDWPTYDEARYARIVARALGTQHHEIPVTAHEIQEVLWASVQHLDEPFADSSLVNVALISKVAREQVKVVLSGDGGDEFFAGYNKYQGLEMARRLRFLGKGGAWLAQLPWPERRGTKIGERLRQMRKLLRLMRPEAFERYIRATLATDLEAWRQRLAPSAFPSPEDVLRPIWQEAQVRYPDDPVNRWLWSDVHFVLPYDMLRKVDTASMMHSLEVRVPFVDREVARLAFRLPGRWKLAGLQRKWILRQIARHLLPQEIIQRPKGGFGIPIGEWMRSELREMFAEYLRPEALCKAMWNPQVVTRLWTEHQTGRRDRFWDLWNIFVFEVWRRQWQPLF